MASASQRFELEVKNELGVAMDEWNTVVRTVTLQAHSRITVRTPVDKGRAKANWFVRIGGAGNKVTENTDKTGTSTIADGAAEIAKYRSLKTFPVISLYNNLPYINRLETGYSNQAPIGMVAVTVTELQAQFR